MPEIEAELTPKRKSPKIKGKPLQDDLDFLNCLLGQLRSESPVAHTKAVRMVERRIETIKGIP